MFIDTYAVLKQLKTERSFVHQSVEPFLNLIDENQGKRELFVLNDTLISTWKTIILLAIQKTSKKVVVVESTRYSPDFEFIHSEDWRKSVKMYDVFIVNFPLSMEEYNSNSLRELREHVALGNKWVIAAQGTKT